MSGNYSWYSNVVIPIKQEPPDYNTAYYGNTSQGPGCIKQDPYANEILKLQALVQKLQLENKERQSDELWDLKEKNEEQSRMLFKKDQIISDLESEMHEKDERLEELEKDIDPFKPEVLFIIRKETDHGDGDKYYEYPYYFSRIQEEKINRKRNALSKRYPKHCEEVIILVGNAVDALNKLVNEGWVERVNTNHVKLLNGITIDQIKEKLTPKPDPPNNGVPLNSAQLPFSTNPPPPPLQTFLPKPAFYYPNYGLTSVQPFYSTPPSVSMLQNNRFLYGYPPGFQPLRLFNSRYF